MCMTFLCRLTAFTPTEETSVPSGEGPEVGESEAIKRISQPSSRLCESQAEIAKYFLIS